MGQAQFLSQMDGAWVKWEWPSDGEGNILNPFSHIMIGDMDSMTWRFERDQRIVQLSFAGANYGPNELIARHPKTWGFILLSQATVWSSWEYHRADTDDVIADENLKNLKVIRLGFYR